jgi:hypothetical protein
MSRNKFQHDGHLRPAIPDRITAIYFLHTPNIFFSDPRTGVVLERGTRRTDCRRAELAGLTRAVVRSNTEALHGMAELEPTSRSRWIPARPKAPHIAGVSSGRDDGEGDERHRTSPASRVAGMAVRSTEGTEGRRRIEWPDDGEESVDAAPAGFRPPGSSAGSLALFATTMAYPTLLYYRVQEQDVSTPGRTTPACGVPASC